MPVTSLEKKLYHRCFLVNFMNIFCTEHLRITASNTGTTWWNQVNAEKQ